MLRYSSRYERCMLRLFRVWVGMRKAVNWYGGKFARSWSPVSYGTLFKWLVFLEWRCHRFHARGGRKGKVLPIIMEIDVTSLLNFKQQRNKTTFQNVEVTMRCRGAEDVCQLCESIYLKINISPSHLNTSSLTNQHLNLELDRLISACKRGHSLASVSWMLFYMSHLAPHSLSFDF